MLITDHFKRFKTTDSRHDEVKKNGIWYRFIFPKGDKKIFAAAEYAYLVTSIFELDRIEVQKESIIINNIDAVGHCWLVYYAPPSSGVLFGEKFSAERVDLFKR